MYRTTLSLLVALTWTSSVQAQVTLETDPPTPLNDYISLGEFEPAGGLDGWDSAGGGANPRLKVANGVLRITTTAGDPWFFRAGLRDLPPAFTTVEVRMKKVSGSSSAWELFYGLTGATGFSGGRRLGFDIPDDNEYHLLHFDLAGALAGGALTDFRIDAGQAAGNVAEIDYVRVGKVSPDTDGDGLPDSFESKTGVFVDSRDTGSDPAKADTDGDKVDDGTEVLFGTDPNNPARFPVPSLKYPVNDATYVVTVAAAENLPAIPLGKANTFAIAPALPAGLELNKTSGVISGTPTAVSAATDYSVTANFAGGISATATVRIEVKPPFIEFPVDQFSFRPGAEITAFSPTSRGPVPKSLQISPALPTGLAFDPATGEISGTPEQYTAVRDYTVTASYTGYPNAAAVVSLSVLESPTLTVDPTEALLGFESLGEFNDEADIANFGIRNGIAELTVVDGALKVQTTGGDPYFGRNYTPNVDFRILEFRMKVTEGSPSPMRFYWAENADGRRNLSELTAHSITELATDGEFHVYRVDFRQSMNASFNVLRIDPGDGAGTTLQLDYLRLGGFNPALSVASEAGGKLRLTWAAAASQAGYKLQSAASIGAVWAADPAVIQTAGSQSSAIVSGDAEARWYRLSK